MRAYISIFLLSLGSILPGCGQANPPQPISVTATPEATTQSTFAWEFEEFTDWQLACDPLPTNRSLRGRLPAKNHHPLSAKEFDRALEAAFEFYTQSPLADSSQWIGASPDLNAFMDTTRVYFENNGVPFTPYAEKLDVSPDTHIIVHGDFHGDIHSLIGFIESLNERQILEGFSVAQEKTHLLFLGDYTDRGAYGAEVIYTLIRLKLASPDKVHLVRGNHEDLSLTARYGFFTELQGKYGRTYDVRKPLRLYDFLPVVFYLGSNGNYVQCNHGGMEPGYNPGVLLKTSSGNAFQQLGVLKQQTYLRDHPEFLEGLDGTARARFSSLLRDFRPESPVAPRTLGFMWNDFSLLRSDPTLNINPGRAWLYGYGATQHILAQASSESHRLRAVIRAHQHSSLLDPMMRRLVACSGIHRHWQEQDRVDLLEADRASLARVLESHSIRKFSDGAVFTLNVAPDSNYGIGCQFDFDVYGEIETAEAFTDWTLTVYNLQSDRW